MKIKTFDLLFYTPKNKKKKKIIKKKKKKEKDEEDNFQNRVEVMRKLEESMEEKEKDQSNLLRPHSDEERL